MPVRARARSHRHARTLPNPEALGPEIEEGAVNRPTEPPLAFPRPGIGLVRIRKINSPYPTNVSKSIPNSNVDTQTPLADKEALDTAIRLRNEIKNGRYKYSYIKGANKNIRNRHKRIAIECWNNSHHNTRRILQRSCINVRSPTDHKYILIIFFHWY